MIWFLSFMIFLSLMLIIYGFFTLFSTRAKLVNRLNSYTNIKYEKDSSEKLHIKRIIRIILNLGRNVGNLGIFKGYKKSVQMELTRAHIPLKGEEFITICIGSASAVFLLSAIALKSFPLGMVMGVPGWFIPALFVKARKKRRAKILNDQLGDAITLISNSLKAGYSFFQAVDSISTEMSGSIADEFAQVKKEINLGMTTENALENLVNRVESDDLELVVTAILIQRQVGGNLAEILDSISETIRERIRIKGEVKTITAQGRMSGIIITAIPPAVGVLMSIINPPYIKLLFTNKIGLILIAISLMMQLMGIYFISRIVKIEV